MVGSRDCAAPDGSRIAARRGSPCGPDGEAGSCQRSSAVSRSGRRSTRPCSRMSRTTLRTIPNAIPLLNSDNPLTFPFSECKTVIVSYLMVHQLEGRLVFSVIKDLGVGVGVAAKQEAVPFLIAFAIAEFFFKFKSFALECLA